MKKKDLVIINPDGSFNTDKYRLEVRHGLSGVESVFLVPKYGREKLSKKMEKKMEKLGSVLDNAVIEIVDRHILTPSGYFYIDKRGKATRAS